MRTLAGSPDSDYRCLVCDSASVSADQTKPDSNMCEDAELLLGQSRPMDTSALDAIEYMAGMKLLSQSRLQHDSLKRCEKLSPSPSKLMTSLSPDWPRWLMRKSPMEIQRSYLCRKGPAI